MKNIKSILLFSIIGFFTSSNCFAQNEKSNFLLITQNLKKTTYYIKVNSEHYDVSNKVDGYPIFGAIFKEEAINKQINFYKLYVSKKDCFNGYGSLHMFELNGQYALSTPFVFDGGNPSSDLSYLLCNMGYPKLEK